MNGLKILNWISKNLKLFFREITLGTWCITSSCQPQLWAETKHAKCIRSSHPFVLQKRCPEKLHEVLLKKFYDKSSIKNGFHHTPFAHEIFPSNLKIAR